MESCLQAKGIFSYSTDSFPGFIARTNRNVVCTYLRLSWSRKETKLSFSFHHVRKHLHIRLHWVLFCCLRFRKWIMKGRFRYDKILLTFGNCPVVLVLLHACCIHKPNLCVWSIWYTQVGLAWCEHEGKGARFDRVEPHCCTQFPCSLRESFLPLCTLAGRRLPVPRVENSTLSVEVFSL